MNLDQGRILITLDGSKISEAALLPGLQLARAYEAPIELMHVVDAEREQPDRKAGNERFEAYARQLLGQAGAADVEWRATVQTGSAADAIIDAAEDARLVVMATHGRGGFHATFIGSVTDKVVRAGKAPVLTVPVQGQVNLMAGPVLVGLDGSERAEAALAVVRDLAQKLAVGVVLLRAYLPTPSTGTEFVMYEYNAVEILKDAAEAYLKEVAREGEQTVTAMVTPATAIAETAEQVGAGMIALTSRGRGLASRIALGSTTDRVIHSVRRPVLVLPSD